MLGNKATINLSFFVRVKEHDLYEFCTQTPKTQTHIGSYFIFYLKTCMWKTLRVSTWQLGRSMRKTWRERLCSWRAWFIEGQLIKTSSCFPLSHNKNTKQFCQHEKVNLFFKWYLIYFDFAISLFVVHTWLQQVKHSKISAACSKIYSKSHYSRREMQ